MTYPLAVPGNAGSPLPCGYDPLGLPRDVPAKPAPAQDAGMAEHTRQHNEETR